MLLLAYRAIGLMTRAFAIGPGDRGSIPGRVIPKTQKMVLDADLLNTQHYKVRIKSKVEQSREWSSAFPLNVSVVAIKKGAFGSLSIKVANSTGNRLNLSFNEQIEIRNGFIGLIGASVNQ